VGTTLRLVGKRTANPSETEPQLGPFAWPDTEVGVTHKQQTQCSTVLEKLTAPKLVMKFLPVCVNPTFHYSVNKSLTFDCPEPDVSSPKHAILLLATYLYYKST
jgi:hypothetical protein